MVEILWINLLAQCEKYESTTSYGRVLTHLTASIMHIISISLVSLALLMVAVAIPLNLVNTKKLSNFIPGNDESSSEELSESSEEITDNTNTTAHNLYVIRAIVYEIGILTDVDENDTTTNDTITNEQVDLTFFNPDKNGSVIDLSNIPIPVQTNISGRIVTGIAPINLGSITSSMNSTNDLLKNLSFVHTIEKLIPMVLSPNSSDVPVENFESSFINNLKTNDSSNLLHPLGFNSLFEPIKLSNESHFTAKIS